MNRLLKLRVSIGVFLIALCCCCNRKQPDAEPQTLPQKTTHQITIPDTSLVVPGKQIGKILLLNDASELETVLGKPDFSDAAMGKAWLTWKKGDGKIEVFTSYKDNTLQSKVIRQIRVTSSDYKLESGITAGSQFDEILKQFPALKKVGEIPSGTGAEPISLYVLPHGNTAFEFQNNVCVAIAIYDSDATFLEYYGYLRTGLVRL